MQLSCAGVENPVLFTLIPLLVDTRSGDTAAAVGYNSSLRVADVAAAEEVCLVSDLMIFFCYKQLSVVYHILPSAAGAQYILLHLWWLATARGSKLEIQVYGNHAVVP